MKKKKPQFTTTAEFLNSPYVKNYFLSTDYYFSPLQRAYLIENCAALTLQEKFEAWSDLIDDGETPNSLLSPLAAVTGEKTLFDFLEAYMRGINEDIKEFCRFDPECVYMTSHGLQVFSTFEKAMEYGLDRRKEEFTVWKIKTDKEVLGKAEYNGENELISIRLFGGKQERFRQSFWNMWFDFPTPFKPGNIIWIPGMKKETMFVVKGKPELTKEETNDNSIMGSEYDMCLEGWLVYEDEEIGDKLTTTVFPHLEYHPYTKELTEKEKLRVNEIRKRL